MRNIYYKLTCFFVLIMSFLLPIKESFADGSRDLYPSGVSGYRASLYVRDGSTTSYPFPSSGAHYVYAEAGETITLASSSHMATGARFTLYGPSGAEIPLSPAGSEGRITNRAAELAGPVAPGASASGNEYIPVYYPVTERSE